MAAGDYKITFTDPAKDASGYFITVQEGTVNVSDTSLILVGRNYPGYGSAIATDLVHLLENFASPTPPNNPIEGQLWFDTTDINAKKLRINDGTANAATWYPVGGVHQQPNEPTNTQLGDVWVDTANNQLKIFNGADFTLIGPNYSSALKTGSVATTATDILGQSHNIIINYVNDNAVEIISQDAFTPLQVIDGFSTIRSGSNLSVKNLGSLTSPSFAQYNGVASQAAALQQTVPAVQTVSANNFVRNDIDQKLNGVLSVGNDAGINIGLDPTFTIRRDSQFQGTFLNSYDGGSFQFRIINNNVQNAILTIKGDSQRVGINTISPKADLEVNGSLYIDGASTFTNSMRVIGNVTAENVFVNSTLTCKFEQILVGPLTIGDSTGTSVTAIIPYNDSQYDIGSPSKKWNKVYSNQFIGSLAGNAATTTRLNNAITLTMTGHVVQTVNSLNQIFGNEGTRNLDTRIVGQAVYGQPSTSTAYTYDSLAIYDPQVDPAIIPDAGVTGNGTLKKITKANFLSEFYAALLTPGFVIPFAGQPSGVPNIGVEWLKCDGASYSITQYPELYSVIGQSYGGTGNQFNVPNLVNQLGSGLLYLDYYIKT